MMTREELLESQVRDLQDRVLFLYNAVKEIATMQTRIVEHIGKLQGDIGKCSEACEVNSKTLESISKTIVEDKDSN